MQTPIVRPVNTGRTDWLELMNVKWQMMRSRLDWGRNSSGSNAWFTLEP
jgi:hypothetical protein